MSLLTINLVSLVSTTDLIYQLREFQTPVFLFSFSNVKRHKMCFPSPLILYNEVGIPFSYMSPPDNFFLTRRGTFPYNKSIDISGRKKSDKTAITPTQKQKSVICTVIVLQIKPCSVLRHKSYPGTNPWRTVLIVKLKFAQVVSISLVFDCPRGSCKPTSQFPIISQIKWVHALTHYFLEIPFYTILNSTHSSPKCSNLLLAPFPSKILCDFSSVPWGLRDPPISASLISSLQYDLVKNTNYEAFLRKYSSES
jgi:hypothetical protein